MDASKRDPRILPALSEEESWVLALGGYSVHLPGATLVINERIPVPRFNFIQDLRLAPGRQAAFFEKALDHYFQRALRPAIFVAEPAPRFLASALDRLGFRASPPTHSLWIWNAPEATDSGSEFEIRPVHGEERTEVANFWVESSLRDELVRWLEVVGESPNPGERLEPWVAFDARSPASAALFHSHGSIHGVHAVVTEPNARGRGSATALVRHLVARRAGGLGEPVYLWIDSDHVDRHFEKIGFERIARFLRFELDPDADLALPTSPAPGPPRWRPPRGKPL